MSEVAVTIELNPRERRLYDRLRDRIVPMPDAGSDGGSVSRSGARDWLLLLPDLTILLMRLLRDSHVPILQKAVAVAGVAYVVSPIDLIPVLVFGPVGLLDDLLIVSACLSRLLNHVHPDVVREHWSGQGDALEVIQNVTGWFEKGVSRRVSDLGDILRGRRSS
ncbi:MAG: DUF1232 domain-containing protein [Myxococcales bacterium]|nr:DUF1232 domain-containing protein [Myxococcales bacterium]HIK83809.1 DUF1232 domain-containing protein [Myxococcales bacterium]